MTQPKIDPTEFNIGVGRRYHLKMSSMYRKANQFVMALSLACGTAVFSSLFTNTDGLIAISVAALLSISSICAMVFDWHGNAVLHRRLYERYCELSRCIEHEDKTTIKDKLAQIEIDEPKPKQIPLLICYNEEANTRRAQEHYPLTWLQRTLGTFITVPPAIWLGPPAKRG